MSHRTGDGSTAPPDAILRSEGSVNGLCDRKSASFAKERWAPMRRGLARSAGWWIAASRSATLNVVEGRYGDRSVQGRYGDRRRDS
jgi:hypothetical protein